MSVLSAMRDVDINERWIESFGLCGNSQRNDGFGVELHTKADDRLHAPKVLVQHDPATGEHRTGQVVQRATGPPASPSAVITLWPLLSKINSQHS